MTGTRPTRAAAEPATLVAWYRVGLTAGVVAVLCALVGLALAIGRVGNTAVVGVTLLLPALVCAFVALGFLRRVWADTVAVGDPWLGRARRWADVASTAWLLALVPGIAVRVLPESFDWLRWLVLALGALSVAAFVAMLALAARWRPARG